MHRFVPAMLLLMPCGCTLTDTAKSSSVAPILTPADALTNGKVVRLDVAVIEQPIGDLYINKELWEQTDNQLVDLEKQAVLDENGFRVGQLVGTPPEKLYALLRSERSCPRPRRRVTPSGSTMLQELSPVRPHAEIRVFEHDKSATVSLDEVECHFDIQAWQMDNGVSRLRFLPKLQYGKVGPIYKSSERGWTMDVTKPSRTFPGASWEVELHANDILVIGAALDREDTLGFQTFVDQGLTPRQRLLVIRALGPTPEESEFEPTADSSLPLARQATMGTVRASRR